MVKKKAEPEAPKKPKLQFYCLETNSEDGTTFIRISVDNFTNQKALELAENIRKIVEMPDEYKVERKMGDYYVSTGVTGGMGYTTFSTSQPE